MKKYYPMRNTKLIGLTLFLFLGFVIPSCEKSTDDYDPYCQCHLYKYFDIKGFNDFTYTRDSLTNRQVMPFDTVSFSTFKSGLLVHYDVDYHAFAEPKSDYSFSLMNTADASCICDVGYGGSKKEKIKSLTITTINDFDDEHSANSSINDLFYIYDSEKNLINFEDFLNSQTGLIQKQSMTLRLKKAPTLNPEFNFKVTLELSNGELYEKTGFPIYIMP